MASKKYIYEVRCFVPEPLSKAFSEWLIEHIDDMTSLPYFPEAEVSHGELLDTPHLHVFIARYLLRSRQDLREYLVHAAPQMRLKLPQEFANKVEFSRAMISQLP